MFSAFFGVFALIQTFLSHCYFYPDSNAEKYKIAVTSGFGPRFLHSTGQLHKGDSGNGIFIQIVDSPSENIVIPQNATESKSDISFDILVQAQALGDRAALLSKNRQVIRCEINSTLIEFIESLKQLI